MYIGAVADLSSKHLLVVSISSNPLVAGVGDQDLLFGSLSTLSEQRCSIVVADFRDGGWVGHGGVQEAFAGLSHKSPPREIGI
jgi:hypothetical protein